MTTGDWHRVLRTTTREEHIRTEAAFAAFDLRSRAGYCAFLAAQAGALLPLEAWLGAQDLGTILPDWPGRRRGALLRQDLAALGETVEPAVPPPSIAGDPLGVAYVLEGSRHGARVLHRLAAANPDPDVARATRFLGQPADAAAWTALLRRIDTTASTHARRDAICVAAIAAFGWFRRSALRVAAANLAGAP